jgi:catechol 2,3-dioxygenase-like lactoylglutathione lyase family enzyme
MDYEFAALVPEFNIIDLQRSLEFWCDGLGFEIAYQRPEEGFAYLERGKVQVMLDRYEADGRWNVGSMEKPFGRGINFQIFVDRIEPILTSLKELNWPLFREVEEKWYRTGDVEGGNRQFLVQDPDGYLLRFAESMGTRALTPKPA